MNSISMQPGQRAGWPSFLAGAATLALFVIGCFAAAAIGGALTAESVNTWYQTINKPTWNPPDWLFGPVWTLLYLMMGIAAWLVWRRAGWRGARTALTLFAVQLALNVAWSGIFFGLRSPGWAFAEIVVLWLAIAATIVAFARHSRPAAGLMTPYLAWTTFATVLNFTLWRLNA